MDAEAYTDAAPSMAISSAHTALKDCDLMEDNLPKLAATPISVCRKLVLQQAVQALGLSMHETTTYDDETNEILTTVRIDVPPHIRLTRLETRLFYGDWSVTSDAAIQSACYNALVYLQKVNVLIIDGIHSSELKHCRRELLQASSWAEAFEQHAAKLESKLSAIIKDKTTVLPVSQTQPKVNLIQETTGRKWAGEHLLVPSGPAQSSLSKPSAIDNEKTTILPISEIPEIFHVPKETTDTKRCADEHVFTPTGPAHIAKNVGHKATLGGVGFVTSPTKNGRPPFVFKCIGKLPFRERRRRDPVPVPEPALAAFNRKKRKLVVDSRRPHYEVATLPSLGSSSKDICATVTDQSDGDVYVSPIHIDAGYTSQSLSTPPSVSRTVILRFPLAGWLF